MHTLTSLYEERIEGERVIMHEYASYIARYGADCTGDAAQREEPGPPTKPQHQVHDHSEGVQSDEDDINGETGQIASHTHLQRAQVEGAVDLGTETDHVPKLRGIQMCWRVEGNGEGGIRCHQRMSGIAHC